MNELYVTQCELNGHPMVMIYELADSLREHVPWLSPDDYAANFLGTIPRTKLATNVAKSIDEHKWTMQERADFDREHSHHLVPYTGNR